jgi:hypothetical protein
MGVNVCPLGLCRTEEVCPNAPCVECMHRLGEHMLEEVSIIEQQKRAAHMRGDPVAQEQLSKLIDSLGALFRRSEETRITNRAGERI